MCRSVILQIVFLCLFLPLVGCGATTPDNTEYQVTGKVLYKGTPAVGANVSFVPTQASEPTRKTSRPRATVDKTGNFQLLAPAGDYKVAIRWPVHSERPQAGQMDRPGGSTPQDRLRAKYTDPGKSPFAVTIQPRVNKLEPFRLK